MARFLYRLTGRADRAADLCQEVFLRVYHAGPRYREAGAFPAWLYRVARNVARDAARGHRRDPAPLPGADPPGPAAPADCSAATSVMEQP